jgi:hypothetical protein
MNTLIKYKNYIAAAAIASLLLLSGLVSVQMVSAQNIKGNLCDGAELSLSNTGSCDNNNPCTKTNAQGECVERQAEAGLNRLIRKIVNVLSTIIGVIAVIMIIWGGFKYITSGGDSNQVASARNTIIYAIVGLIIVALAQFIVRFVLNNVG